MTQGFSQCAVRPLQGFSRFDAMIRLTRSIRYTHLRSCGHLTFVGSPLETDLALVGCPLLTLWVESSDSDADIFAYLEDQDPETGKARCAAGLPLLASVISEGAAQDLAPVLCLLRRLCKSGSMLWLDLSRFSGLPA